MSREIETAEATAKALRAEAVECGWTIRHPPLTAAMALRAFARKLGGRR